MSKYRVTIDLDFEELPYYKDVVDYLKDLIEDEELNYTVLNNATAGSSWISGEQRRDKIKLDKG